MRTNTLVTVIKSDSRYGGADKLASARKATLGLLLCATQFSFAADFPVTTTADSGAGSIREQINAANTAGGVNTISFSGGGIGTITLASALPSIASDLTIDGGQYGSVFIDGASNSRIFFIESGNVTLAHLELVHGTAHGGNGSGSTGSGGGGGLGAGGCVFINTSAVVTLNVVGFDGCTVQGGSGGTGGSTFNGGGGGGGLDANATAESGATGGSGGGGNGGAPSGGNATGFGGGGAGGNTTPIGTHGGNGGFGGGGGGGGYGATFFSGAVGGTGGFGAGGGGGHRPNNTGGSGGSGAGNGGTATNTTGGAGGGGAAFGPAVFNQGTLTIINSGAINNTAIAGTAGGSSAAAGTSDATALYNNSGTVTGALIDGLPGPQITTSAGTTAFVEGDNATSTPVAIDSSLILEDPAAATLASVTITIPVNFASGEDVLAFTNDGSTMGNISGSYASSTGTLTLTSSGASAILAQWQAALRTVTYTNNSDTPNTSTRGISFIADDGSLTSMAASKSISVTSVNDTPSLSPSGGSTAFIQGNPMPSTPVAVDSGISVGDLDNTTLASATIAITNNFQSSEDVLAFTNDGSTMGNVSGSYMPGTGVLTLSSSGATATLAQWQAALRSVTYTNSAIAPNTGTRTVNFSVNDGTISSPTAFKLVTITLAMDVNVSISNGTATINGGQTTEYTITVRNNGPSAAPGVMINFNPPMNFTGVIWECNDAGGAVCPSASGSGAIAATANLPAGSSLTYMVSGTVSATPETFITCSVTLTPPSSLHDLSAADDTATDTDPVGVFIDGFE